MKNFIMVHTKDSNNEFRVNVDAIIHYGYGNIKRTYTTIVLQGDYEMEVIETPEEIDALIDEEVYDPDKRL